jgi:hypothetical protein
LPILSNTKGERAIICLSDLINTIRGQVPTKTFIHVELPQEVQILVIFQARTTTSTSHILLNAIIFY